MKKYKSESEEHCRKRANLFPPTETQSEIIDNFNRGYNQVVTAVPGAGKTTLAILLALLPSISIVLITFSKRLRDETKARADELGLENMDVRTFHSIGCHYYYPNTRSDLDLLEICKNDLPPSHALPVDVDCVILDESQDMCKEQFLFCYKFLTDIYCEKQKHTEQDAEQDAERGPGIQKTRMIIMGDENQCIFPYKGADSRFLSMAEELWLGHPLFREMKQGCVIPPPFYHVSMNGTNRLPGPIVDFLNFNEMCTKNQKKPLVSLKSQRLAEKEGQEKTVHYWRLKKTDMIQKIMKEMETLLNSGEIKPGDIFIICPSIHKNFIAKEILNELTLLGYPCFYPNQDESDKTDDQVLLNKICFLTGHSSKGRERRFCFLLGFDSSYYQFMDREASPSECTNLLYVGCTRSTEKLYLCQFYTENQTTYYQNRPQDMRFTLPFLKMSSMGMITGEYSDFLTYFGEGNMNEEKGVVEKILEQREERGIVKINATDMVNFLPTVVLDILNQKMKNWWITDSPAHREIEIPSVIVCGGGGGAVEIQEDVSDLNGLAIPSIFMTKYFRDTPKYLYDRLHERLESMDEKKKNGKHFKMLLKKLQQLPPMMWEYRHYLFYFNMEQACSNQVFHRLRQISNYEWLDSQETIQKLMKEFEGVLGEEMAESRQRGIRPCLEYDLFSSFSPPPLPLKKEEPSSVDADADVVVAVGSLESTSSIRSYMGSMISSSSEEWEESSMTPPLENEMDVLLAKDRIKNKSEFFHEVLINALTKIVETSPEYVLMNTKEQQTRRWYEGRNFTYSGVLDLVTHSGIWEMKCTSMLSKEHQLQLLLYAWFWKGLGLLYQKSPESFSDKERKYLSLGQKEFHLFNVKTSEHLRLSGELSFEELTEFVAMWIDGKNNSVALSVHLSDAEFMRILEEV